MAEPMTFDELSARIGKFYISSTNLEHDLSTVRMVMQQVIIVRCEHIFHNSLFEYMAYCEHFEKILDVELPPHYEFIVTREGGYPVEVTFKRKR